MTPELKKAFDFDESDLRLNKRHQISEKQLKLLSGYRRMYGFFGKLALVVFLISLGSISLIALYNIGIDLTKNPVPVIALIAFFSIGMLLFLFFLALGNIRSDLKSGKISQVEGIAEHQKKKMPRRLGTAYFVTVGQVRFQLDTAAKYKALDAQSRYRIFYIKHPPAHIILSIAEISS